MLKGPIRRIAKLDARVTESPVWDSHRRALHFVDIYGCRIYTLDWGESGDGPLSCMSTREPVGCVGLSGEGYFVAGLQSGLALIDRRNGQETRLGRIDVGAGNRLNDGRCDPAGRFFWVGSMAESLDVPAGKLYRYAPDGAVEVVTSDLICSNGLAWSPDGSVMYHADTRQKTVWAYDYDAERGIPSNRRIFFKTVDGEGRPDGAAVDRDGCYWTARYDGWRIVRHAPDGKELFTLRTPVQNPTMCGFAGEDLSTLVFTSARGSLNAAQLAAQPDAGSVFAVDVDVQGFAEPHFIATPPQR